MPRICTVCTHPERPAIDQEIVAGEAFSRISRVYRVSEDAISRHRVHIPAAMAKALGQQAREEIQAEDLMGQVKAFRNKALDLMKQAEKAGDLRTAIAGLREARSCLELLAEMEGELDRRPVVNLHLSTEWIEVRTVLLSTLAPYPEARAAVASRLLQLEGDDHAAGR